MKTGAMQLPARIAYLKLGTAGLETNERWEKRFAEATQRWTSTECLNGDRIAKLEDDAPPGLVKWIAVAYADWEVARGPCPEEVLEGARDCGCAGVLIDTHSKEDGRLLDWLNVDRLAALAGLARSRGLEFAVAGRLQIADWPRLSAVHPDIVGIRSAACRSGIRDGDIDASAVRTFREALQGALERATI
jgi:hypothetical protein